MWGGNVKGVTPLDGIVRAANRPAQRNLCFLRQYQLGQVQRVASPGICPRPPLNPQSGTPLRALGIGPAILVCKTDNQKAENSIQEAVSKEFLRPIANNTTIS